MWTELCQKLQAREVSNTTPCMFLYMLMARLSDDKKEGELVPSKPTIPEATVMLPHIKELLYYAYFSSLSFACILNEVMIS
jgi:hypothetical protein